MSIFNNCGSTGGGSVGDGLPLGTRIAIRGDLPAPANYRFVDGLLLGGVDQGHGPADVTLTLRELDSAPVAGVSGTYCVGRANNGYFLYEPDAGAGGVIRAYSVQFREAGGNWVGGLSAWPAAIEAAGVRRIAAFDVLGVIQETGVKRVAAVVETDDDQHNFIVWDVDGFDWTEVYSASTQSTGPLVPQCFSYFVEGETACIGIGRGYDFYVFNPDTVTAEPLTGAFGANSPGGGLDAGLASRPDGRTLFGSKLDNLVRARKLTIVEVDEVRYVASPFKSTVMPVAGVEASAHAVAVVNLTDDDFDVLAPFGWFRVGFTEFGSVARQIAARHPLITSTYAPPMAATYLDPFADIFVLIYVEKLESGKYAVRELDMSREALLSTFFRYAEKIA